MNNYARMKFYCDEERCIECNGCTVACAEAHELPTGISRRKVVTLNEGIFGKEFSVSVACMHCTDAPCEQVCPVDCFYEGKNMLVIKPDECIDCGVCEPECPIDAIKADTEEGSKKWLEVNKKYSEIWPNINTRKERLQNWEKFENEEKQIEIYYEFLKHFLNHSFLKLWY